MQDPVGNAWSWQFDSLGRMWDEQDPDAGRKVYTYDDAGRLLTMTDAKSQTTTLVYDTTVGRLQSRTNAAGTVNYTYSEARSGYLNVGQPTTVTSPSSVLQTDYDALGRAVRLRRTLDGTVYTVAKSFDASGRLLSTTYPDGDVVGLLGYDEAGRLDTIPGIVSNVTYDAAGRPLTLANQNATNTSWSYEAERQFLSRIQTTSPQGTIQDMQYLQYTDAGLLQQVTSPIAGEGRSYDYDDLNHLTSATNLSYPAENQSWSYDPADRITYNSRVGSYTYPPLGQPRPHAPATVNGASFSYDPNGNLLSGNGRSLVWDANNRITQVTKSGLTASFTYDGEGERLKKTSSQGTTLYPFGDDYEITNGVVTKYISVERLGVIAKRVGSGAGATTYWLHTDRLGSIQAVTNSTGAAVYRRTYRPYGETLGTSGTHTESRGWIDQRNDGESGLAYLHARYFDPKLGQFLSPDPIGTAGGLNQYGYAFGNPPNGTDRGGLKVVLVGCHSTVVIAAVPHVDVGKVRIDDYEECTYADLPDVPPEKYSTGRQDDDPGGWPQTGQNQGDSGTAGGDSGGQTCTGEDCQPPPPDPPTDPPAEPKKALKAERPYPFKDPCFTGYWGRFWDSVDWQNDKVLGEVGHAAEMAEMVVPVAVLTTIGAYAESARRYGGSLLPMAPGGFLGGPWLGSGGGLARAAKFARTPAGVVGVGIGVGVFSAAAVDAYRSGCH